MTTLGFIRHGITQWNKEGREQGQLNIPLHSEGILAAQKLANNIDMPQWDAIFTSPLARAQQTAEILMQQHANIPLYQDTRLCEIGTGLIEGTTEEERIQKWGKQWAQLKLGVEPKQNVLHRCQSFLADIEQNFLNNRVLVVSHGDLLQHLFQLLGFSLPRVDNTTLTIIKQENGANHLLLYNKRQYKFYSQ